MSKSNKYGYSGVDIPTQAAFANVGKFDPAEINELVQEDKWTQYGQLELIETQSSTSYTEMTFSDIKETTYNVHVLQFSNVKMPSGAGTHYPGFRFSQGGTFNTSNYDYAASWFSLTGSGNSSVRNSNHGNIAVGIGSSHSLNFSGYAYFYNLGDSIRYSYATGQIVLSETGGTVFNSYFSGASPYTSQVDGIKFMSTNTPTMTSGTFSLYGIRYS